MMRWTPAELELLRSMYPECHTDDVAAWLGCNVKRVYNGAKVHSVRKSAAYLASDAAARIQRGKHHPSMIASRFQAGFTPWNKGKPGTTGVQAACRATQFRPGSKPPTTLPVGSYRLVHETSTGRKVLEQKTGEASGANHKRWTPVARIVWEAAHGPVPPGHLVVFKRGMHTHTLEEITADRLECIDRAENARRNHPANRSPELAKLVQLKGAITRQVNRINREQQESRT